MRLVGAVSLFVFLAACSNADQNGTPIKGGKGGTSGNSAEDDTNGEQTNPNGSGDDRTPGGQTPNGTTPDAGTTTPGAPDGDNDGVPDSEDCDPVSAVNPGTKLLDDPLTSDKGFFTIGAGFGQSWSFTGAGLRQDTRVSDVSDLEVFNKDAAIGDVIVEVRAASTEINNVANPTLRQMFIMVGTTVTGGVLSGVGCGLEVITDPNHTQKTTVARFSGSPGAISVTPLQRVDRPAVQVNEEFGMKAILKGGTLTCEVQQAAKTTATANVGTVTGSVGLLTRQTKALFKNARICKLK